MNLEGYEAGPVDRADLAVEDRWILSELARTAADADDDLEDFRFADLAKRLRDFTWGSFCDWYVEFSKARLRDPATRTVAQRVLATVLDGICRLVHPIMPFVTESIWHALAEVAPSRGLPEPSEAAESVCIAPWPSYPEDWRDDEAEADVAQWREKIQAIRNLRAERNVPKGAAIAPTIVASGAVAEAAPARRGPDHGDGPAASVAVVESADRPPEAAVAVLADAEVILPLAGLIDREAEAAKTRKALLDVERQVQSIRGKLANESFVSKAPEAVVAQQRARLSELETQAESLEGLLHPS